MYTSYKYLNSYKEEAMIVMNLLLILLLILVQYHYLSTIYLFVFLLFSSPFYITHVKFML